MKKFLFVVVAAAILAAVVMVPAPAGAECATCIAFGYGRYGYGGYGQTGTGQIHEWLDLAERGTAMVPKAVAAIILTEKMWESRAPRPPQQVVYVPPVPPAPPAPPVPATGRLVIIGSTAPGELFLDGESKGSLGSLEVKSFDLPTGQHSVILKTPKKVFVKTASVQPSVSVVINFDP